MSILRFGSLVLLLGLPLATAIGDEKGIAGTVHDAKSVDAAKQAIARFSLSNIRLSNPRESGWSEATTQAFEAELAKRLAERETTETAGEMTSKGTVEVRFDTLTVQGDFTRGKEDQPIPRDLFAATVRILDDAGQEISIHVIPETQIRGERLNIDPSKLLGVEGAAIVYRKLFGTF